MTKAFVLVRRAGDVKSLEIEQLTDQELDTLVARMSKSDGWRYAKFLAKWIRDNVKKEDLIVA